VYIIDWQYLQINFHNRIAQKLWIFNIVSVLAYCFSVRIIYICAYVHAVKMHDFFYFFSRQIFVNRWPIIIFRQYHRDYIIIFYIIIITVINEWFCIIIIITNYNIYNYNCNIIYYNIYYNYPSRCRVIILNSKRDIGIYLSSTVVTHKHSRWRYLHIFCQYLQSCRSRLVSRGCVFVRVLLHFCSLEFRFTFNFFSWAYDISYFI
jgi:hypothetical protein